MRKFISRAIWNPILDQTLILIHSSKGYPGKFIFSHFNVYVLMLFCSLSLVSLFIYRLGWHPMRNVNRWFVALNTCIVFYWGKLMRRSLDRIVLKQSSCVCECLCAKRTVCRFVNEPKIKFDFFKKQCLHKTLSCAPFSSNFIRIYLSSPNNFTQAVYPSAHHVYAILDWTSMKMAIHIKFARSFACNTHTHFCFDHIIVCAEAFTKIHKFIFR